MNIRFVIAFVVILAAPAIAQRGFYIRPGVEQKISMNPGKPVELITEQDHHMSIAPLRCFSSGSFNIGLAIGYKMERSFIELCEWQDEAEVGALLNYNSLAQDSTVFLEQNKYYHGSSYGRSSFQYGFRLFHDRTSISEKKTRWELWGYVAHDFFHRPAIPAKDSGGASWKFSQVDSVSMQYELSTPQRFSGYARAGLLVKAFNAKGHSIFNFSVSYSHALSSHRNMANSIITITNYSDGLKYIHVLRSNGSGFYFQFSKDIYFNNLFKKKTFYSSN